MNNLRWDNALGMIASQVATWSIIVVAATVLHGNGVIDIKTSADAAMALEPLVSSFPNAGFLAKVIFSIGIIGLGFLSIPVLSGSAAYAVAEAFNWREGLNLKLKKAHGFYGVITIATLVGLMINFIGIDPVKALVYSAVINGIIAVPLIFLIAKIAQNKSIMGQYQSGLLSRTFVWLTFIAMAVAALTMLVMFVI
jgi:Mn2+/Fe2+ NRAMP family transporter